MLITLIITLCSPDIYSVIEVTGGRYKDVAHLVREHDPLKWITNRYILPEPSLSYLRREMADGAERFCPIFRVERK